MPSKSGKQHRLMALVANDPKAAKRLGIPQSVGRDYVEADKGRKFGDSNMMKKGMKDKMGRAMAMRGDMADKMGRAMAKPMGMKKGGMAKSGGSVFRKAADGIAHKGKTKGKIVKMMMGGKC